MSRQSVDNTLNKRTENRQADNGRDDSGKGRGTAGNAKMYLHSLYGLDKLHCFMHANENKQKDWDAMLS